MPATAHAAISNSFKLANLYNGKLTICSRTELDMNEIKRIYSQVFIHVVPLSTISAIRPKVMHGQKQVKIPNSKERKKKYVIILSRKGS